MQPTRARRSLAHQGMARITGNIEDTWLLDGVDGPARRAASCHLRPAQGDRVWFVREGDDCFITAVLERAQPNASRTLDLGDDVTLRAGRALGVETDGELRVRASKVSAAMGTVSVFAKTMVGHVARRTMVGSVLEQVLDRVTTHAKTSQRTVEGLDQVVARDVDHRAEGTLSLGGEHTMIAGRTLVKADGKQIHIG